MLSTIETLLGVVRPHKCDQELLRIRQERFHSNSSISILFRLKAPKSKRAKTDTFKNQIEKSHTPSTTKHRYLGQATINILSASPKRFMILQPIRSKVRHAVACVSETLLEKPAWCENGKGVQERCARSTCYSIGENAVVLQRRNEHATLLLVLCRLAFASLGIAEFCMASPKLA